MGYDRYLNPFLRVMPDFSGRPLIKGEKKEEWLVKQLQSGLRRYENKVCNHWLEIRNL
jgi:hypothetical protein